MKKRRLLSLLLAMALLAGCAPGVESPAPNPVPTESAAAPAPTPEPTPTPAPIPEPAPEPVDFREFLDGVNAARKAAAAQTEPIEIPAEYIPDFYEQNSTFTEAELELLTTAHNPEENLTREDLIADAETFFTLLQTTYGAYYYFGGDEIFLPILDTVKEDLAAADNPTVSTLEEILYQHLAPVLVDGHFMIGYYAPRDTFAKYMYYVPNLYLDSPEGVENLDYIKPTIDPDGRICWWYAALSHDGSDLPDTLDGNTLKWQRALGLQHNSDAPVFSESEWEGVPVLTSRHMGATGTNADAQEQTLQRLYDCGGEYSDSPLLIFDVRGNTGGSDYYINHWFADWSEGAGQGRYAAALRASQLACRLYTDNYCPVEDMGKYRVVSSTGAWAERSGPVFVLQDNNVCSAGESVVENFRTAADTLFVGGPTSGIFLIGGNFTLYLPHSGLSCFFGTTLRFQEGNQEGRGYLPDLWVEPTQAMVLVKKLIGYYGLAEEG